ncbi:TPA: polymorphic toxin-type HINT domain-containing protein [Yersinia enterocolitica]
MATINERLRDEAIAHSLFQSRYGAGVAREMVKVLNESDAEISARLIVALDGVNPNSVTVKRLESLLASVRLVNKQAINAMYASLSDELLDFAKHEAGYQLSLFDSLLPGSVLNRFPLAAITQEQVYAAAMAQPFQGRLLRDWAENIEADRMTRIINTVKNGYLAGDTVEQMVRKVRGTKARNYQDGAIDAGRRNVTAVVKTAVTHLAAVARDKFADNNSNIIDAKQWLSTLDNKTSHDCIIRDRLKYTLEGKPIGHKVPYLQGPGRIHFCAVVEGTLIVTDGGTKPVENIQLGDMVLTHKGTFEPVTQKLSKNNQHGVIVEINTYSGRRIRITHDHPVLTVTGWKFAGALKIGDKLFHDGKEIMPIANSKSIVSPDADNYPTRIRQTLIALLRTAEFVSTEIDLNSHSEGWDREVEDVVVESILRNPSIVMGESERHHLLALGHLLGELGLKRLGNLLPNIIANRSSKHSLTCGLISTNRSVGFDDHRRNTGHSAGVIFHHPFRVGFHHGISLFSESEEMMLRPRLTVHCASLVALPDLLGFGSNTNIVLDSESGKDAISNTEISFDGTERESVGPMLGLYNAGVIGEFSHDAVKSIIVVDYIDKVYDLGVGESNSYFADGLLVSNCRSMETLITKSWRELGIDIDEMDEGTRASMDGQVPAGTTYGEWLQRQSYRRQVQVLGETRARLMKDAGMRTDEFFTDTGEWLTLKQLQQFEL